MTKTAQSVLEQVVQKAAAAALCADVHSDGKLLCFIILTYFFKFFKRINLKKLRKFPKICRFLKMTLPKTFFYGKINKIS